MPLFCQEDPHVAVDQAKLEKLINPKPDSSTENMGPLVKFMVANDHEKKAFLDGLKTHSLAELENSFAETGLMIACALKEAIELEQLTEQEIKDYRYQIQMISHVEISKCDDDQMIAYDTLYSDAQIGVSSLRDFVLMLVQDEKSIVLEAFNDEIYDHELALYRAPQADLDEQIENIEKVFDGEAPTSEWGTKVDFKKVIRGKDIKLPLLPEYRFHDVNEDELNDILWTIESIYQTSFSVAREEYLSQNNFSPDQIVAEDLRNAHKDEFEVQLDLLKIESLSKGVLSILSETPVILYINKEEFSHGEVLGALLRVYQNADQIIKDMKNDGYDSEPLVANSSFVHAYIRKNVDQCFAAHTAWRDYKSSQAWQTGMYTLGVFAVTFGSGILLPGFGSLLVSLAIDALFIKNYFDELEQVKIWSGAFVGENYELEKMVEKQADMRKKIAIQIFGASVGTLMGALSSRLVNTAVTKTRETILFKKGFNVDKYREVRFTVGMTETGEYIMLDRGDIMAYNMQAILRHIKQLSKAGKLPEDLSGILENGILKDQGKLERLANTTYLKAYNPDYSKEAEYLKEFTIKAEEIPNFFVRVGDNMDEEIIRAAAKGMEEMGEVSHLLETLLIRSENKRSIPGMIRALVNNRLNSILSRPLSKAAGQAGQETDL